MLRRDVCASQTPRVRPKGVRPDQALVLVGEHRLDLEFDPHFLTDQETARLERLVPPHVKVLAVEGRRGSETRADLSPRIDADAGELHVEADRASDIADRQLAKNLPPAACWDGAEARYRNSG